MSWLRPRVTAALPASGLPAVLALFGVLGCEEKICGPGDQRACACETGGGTQTCNVRGTEWGACQCTQPKPAADVPSRPSVTIVSADDLGPADPAQHPDSKVVRVTFTVSGEMRGEPTLTDSKQRKFTGRSETSPTPTANHQVKTFVVPNDAAELRFGIGADDPGQKLGELKAADAAERFKKRMIRERK